MRSHAAILAAWVLGGVVVLGGGQAWGQAPAPAIQLEHFEPTADPGNNLLQSAGSDVLPHLGRSLGALTHFAAEPLVLVGELGGERVVVIEDQLRVELLMALGLFDRMSLELAVPFVAAQRFGDVSVLQREPGELSFTGFGDARLTTRVRLLERIGGVGIGLGSTIWFPTGDAASLNSGDGLRLEPRLSVDLRRGRWWIIGNIGYQLRNLLQLHNIVTDDVLRWSVAGRAPLGDLPLAVFASAFGSASFEGDRDPFDLGVDAPGGINRSSPVEVLGGLEWESPWALRLRAGGGAALSSGIGAPSWRGLLELGWELEGLGFEGPPEGLVADSSPEGWNVLSSAPHLTATLTLLAPSGLGATVATRDELAPSPSPWSVAKVETGAALSDLEVAAELQVAQASPEGAATAGLGRDVLLRPLVAVGLFNTAEIGAGLPVVVGESGVGTLSDLELRLKGMGLDADEGGLGVGMFIPLTIPLQRSAFSQRRFEVGTVGVAEVRLGPLTPRLNLGVKLADNVGGDVPLLGALVWGIAADVPLGDRRVWLLGAEAAGERSLRGLFDAQPGARDSLALLLRHSVSPALSWELGGNAQLGAEDTPQIGVQAGLTWRMVDVDTDRDGILDADDACPDAAEDRDGFQDVEGCPEPDNDRDGILDVADLCPQDAEDRDGFQDEDGCPELDNDGDGIIDGEDKCPMVAGMAELAGCPDPDGDMILAPRDRCPQEGEDRDGFQDEDGCPDLDNDEDGLLDADDGCPNAAEDRDGFQDEDGCPDLDNDGDGVPDREDRCPLVLGIQQWQGCTDVVVQITFALAKATIRSESLPTLDDMAAIITSNPRIGRVEIQGHTDDIGVAAVNTRLSQERAERVRQHLIERGVAPERLVARGYGPSQPVVDPGGLRGKALNEARAQNRRVVFRLLDAVGAP